MFTGVLVYFIYNNLVSVAVKSVEAGTLPPQIGVWIVHVALALIVLSLILYQELYGWGLPSWLGRLVRRFGARRADT